MGGWGLPHDSEWPKVADAVIEAENREANIAMCEGRFHWCFPPHAFTIPLHPVRRPGNTVRPTGLAESKSVEGTVKGYALSRQEQLEQVKCAIAGHPLYGRIRTPEALRSFMERHVICVWDFMWLLKSLQRDLTCVQGPWLPPQDPEAARLINEIVLGEETDALEPGVYGSHFEWYVSAMQEVGCDLGPITRLLAAVRAGQPVEHALHTVGLPSEAVAFVRNTMSVLDRPVHVRTAVFFHSREDMIPRMFVQVVQELHAQGLRCATLRAYLQRHIEVDRDSHAPLAQRLLCRLYAHDPARQREAEEAALAALVARQQLWNVIAARLEALHVPCRTPPGSVG
jgi:hypothetical protein